MNPGRHAWEAWQARDPDPTTREELERLMTRAAIGDEVAQRELADAFSGELSFGTAGVRAKLGPGPKRMNRVVVRRVASGVVHWLGKGGAGGVVVVGYDGRRNSAEFARDAAGVIAASGYDVVLYDQMLPTPVVAFAARQLRARCAVMVTASHNPAVDNGVKLYDESGCQILPEVASVVEAGAAAARGAGAEPVVAEVEPRPAREMLERYREQVLARLPDQSGEVRDAVRVVYTAMHGVGGETFEALCREAGFGDVVVVREQHLPDPAFPTTAFPNPEEPAALELAGRLARKVTADVIVANDPDADRCAVAVREQDGRYRRLTGDELGAALLWWLVRTGRCVPGDVVASSVVSSQLLGSMAGSYGLVHRRTLTGFKWISRVPGLVYGYEEALGYCLDPGAVGDKDGLSAALEVCAMTATLKAGGRSVVDVLDEIDERFGVHRQNQVTIPIPSPAAGAAMVEAVMAELPTQITGLGVEDSYRLADTARSGVEHPTEGAVIVLAGQGRCRGARVILRPSGTEPKLKVYLEVVAESAVVADYHLTLLAHDLRWRLTTKERNP